jgi:aspartate aminotransferase-like enzyme
MIRPSVVGYTNGYDKITVVAVLEDVLCELGKVVPHGSGVASIMKALA